MACADCAENATGKKASWYVYVSEHLENVDGNSLLLVAKLTKICLLNIDNLYYQQEVNIY